MPALTPHSRDERGLTLTEVTVVMILGTMIMAGMVGFYLSSQGLWLDASTQAITQREATLVSAAMRDSIRKSGSAQVFPSPDATHQMLVLFRKHDYVDPFYSFWWSPSDSLIYAGTSVGDPTSGPMVVSHAVYYEMTATDKTVRVDMRLRSASGQTVDSGALAVMQNR